MKFCHRCRTAWSEPGQPGFNNTCAHCGIALHACSNCRWYVHKGKVRCLKPGAPEILDAAAANRCNLFEFLSVDQTIVTRADAAARVNVPATPAQAREIWNDLFGGP